MNSFSRYVTVLNSHPGTPIASIFTALGFVAGAKGDMWFVGGVIGAVIMSVFWIPVLWTSYEIMQAREKAGIESGETTEMKAK